MKFEIKDRTNGVVLFSIETETWKLAVEAAVKAKANLAFADLRYANLRYADLRYANLRAANLSYADLSYADLRSADLRAADLRAANLSSADLREVKNAELVIAQTLIVSDGPMFGWKKCQDNVIVKLFIPSKAARSNATGRKCRAERAKVLEVIGAEKGVSIYDAKTLYEAGKWVHCDKWNPDRWEECGGGIHFFITRAEAEAYS